MKKSKERVSFLVFLVILAAIVGLFFFKTDVGDDTVIQDDKLPVEGFEGQAAIRYMPLGDSYTFGMGVEPGEAWPALLVNHLKEDGFDIELLSSLSIGGATSSLLLHRQLPVYEASNPTLATLMVGTNDWLRDDTPEEFRENLGELLDRMKKKLKKKDHLVVLSVPDLSASPEGNLFSFGRDIEAGLKSFNVIIKEEAEKRDLTFIDMFEFSQAVRDDQTLAAEDGFHQSVKEHLRWEERIYPVILEILER